jgi:pullulanase
VKKLSLRLLFLLIVLLFTSLIIAQEEDEQPSGVSIPGTFQAILGCDDDWQPGCAATALEFDTDDLVWRNTFEIPAGSYEYKVAIDGTWTENYGGSADQDGPNVNLVLEEDTEVTFIYDHATNWIADSVGDRIVTAPGNYQDEIGCSGEWLPGCLLSWLQDPDGDGVYTLSTFDIPAGDYEVKAAINQTWDENYGAEGAADGANIPFSVPADGTQVNFAFNSGTNMLAVGVGEPANVGRTITVDINRRQAHWVLADTIAWNIATDEGITYALHYALDASLEGTPTSLQSALTFPLTLSEDGLPAEALQKFPHLADFAALQLPEDALEQVPEILRGQAVVSAMDANGTLINATGLQIAGVLDDLFTYDGELGTGFNEDGVPTVSVWAPTAQNVRFHLFEGSDPDAESQALDMDYDPESGIWSITGDPSWQNQYYLYEVEVYAPTVQGIVTNMVTDPYSYSLSMNSQRTQLVDIDDPAFMPDGWMTLEKPSLAVPEDITIYELHVRDFSSADPAVPEELVGTFAAFTVEDSNGMQHLQALSDAGMTHLHLLPSFDIATINENPEERIEPPADELAELPGDSVEQAQIIDAIRDQDAFNWGYDPYHYTVPEGSYSTDPDGPQRIIEFREMVQSLNEIGLRVVIDVVYNHTNAAGQSDRSVLDRIVPGYYHRLDANGVVATSTCCQNTATEHNMMRKLMIDSVVDWATIYKVDGFRFDLMGHHMLQDMIEVREALDSLTVEEDGVDGESIYVYGEGWDFGEVGNEARGVNATQINIAGTGIGTFNDRLRDAVRGGSPVQGETLQYQGVGNGLYYTPNDSTPGDEEAQLDSILNLTDQIRASLAGNLAGYTFEGSMGETITGAQLTYGDSAPAAYTLDPQENIVYVAAHDNETLWDAIQLKAPEGTPVEERIRMNNLSLSYVAFTQGIPFFHAGDDLLRSKSLDRDSYNSGDWFNRLDFTYEDNNWAVGVGPTRLDLTDLAQPLLADESLAVTSAQITATTAYFQELLRIRMSSVLFRLRTAEQIEERVAFHNTGTDQIPGVIVMSIDDAVGEDLDPDHEMIVVVFNASPDEISFSNDVVAEMAFELHPIMQDSVDAVTQSATFTDGAFTVPGRTTAVFVVPQS